MSKDLSIDDQHWIRDNPGKWVCPGCGRRNSGEGGHSNECWNCGDSKPTSGPYVGKSMKLPDGPACIAGLMSGDISKSDLQAISKLASDRLREKRDIQGVHCNHCGEDSKGDADRSDYPGRCPACNSDDTRAIPPR